MPFRFSDEADSPCAALLRDLGHISSWGQNRRAARSVHPGAATTGRHIGGLRRDVYADQTTRAVRNSRRSSCGWPRVSMTASDLTGFAASALVLLTFAMNDMRLLRAVGILSNVAFIIYAGLNCLLPVLLLHVLLLPINGYMLLRTLPRSSAHRVRHSGCHQGRDASGIHGRARQE